MRYFRLKPFDKRFCSPALFLLLCLTVIICCSGFAAPIDNCAVHFIDVGQADSILIQADGAGLLIDAGNNADAKKVCSYIRAQGINRLEYIIGTHPHEDHIGGMDKVVLSFETGQVIMPKVSNNTKTFKDLLQAIAAKGLRITNPVVGNKYPLGKGYFQIIAPNRTSYEDLNDYSVVIRFVYGKKAFLLMGDASRVSEAEIIDHKLNIQADVIKIGHHGSNTATSREFLARVQPTYAVISVGKDNDYGQPAVKTLELLKQFGIIVYRTDIHGTISAFSDGETLRIETEKDVSQYGPGIEQEKEQFIGNINSRKFHRKTCDHLPLEGNRKYFRSRDEALREGYSPCKICQP